MKTVAFSLLVMTGCATLFAGGPDQVPVNTNPPGAYVYVNGNVVGQTPTIVQLDRGETAQIQIYLPGFQPVVMMRDKTINNWFWANILWLPTFLWVVDLIDGAVMHYDDTAIAIGLTPAGPNGAAAPPSWYQQPQPVGPVQPVQPMQPVQPSGPPPQ